MKKRGWLSWENDDLNNSESSEKSFGKISLHQTREHSGRKICVIKKNPVNLKQSLEQANELVSSL
jgi:hypothetical protein